MKTIQIVNCSTLAGIFAIYVANVSFDLSVRGTAWLSVLLFLGIYTLIYVYHKSEELSERKSKAFTFVSSLVVLVVLSYLVGLIIEDSVGPSEYFEQTIVYGAGALFAPLILIFVGLVFLNNK